MRYIAAIAALFMLGLTAHHFLFAITRSQLMGKWSIHRVTDEHQEITGTLYLQGNGTFYLQAKITSVGEPDSRFAGKGTWNVFCRHFLIDWDSSSVSGFNVDLLDDSLPISSFRSTRLTMAEESTTPETWVRPG